MIKSISYSQEEIINSIIKLHLKGEPIDCDPTYSKGVFYKNITKPKHIFDLYPQTEDTLPADCRHLPLGAQSIDSLMFDPPFVISKGPSLNTPKEGQNIISNRFSSFPNPKELFTFYRESLTEFYRILKTNGTLIFKCQDTVSSGKQYVSHVTIINEAEKLGFYTKDLFILLAKSRLISPKHANQQHARKFHSYFIVFIKK